MRGTRAGTIAVPNDCSKNIDRKRGAHGSTGKNAKILRNSHPVPQHSVRIIGIAGVGSTDNFTQVVDPNRITAEATRQRTDRLHARSAAP